MRRSRFLIWAGALLAGGVGLTSLASAQTYYRSRPIARSVEIGRPVAVGRPVTVGRPVAVGVPVVVGRPVQVGTPLAVGRSIDVGRPVAVGRPVVVGSPVSVGTSVSVGVPANVARPALVGAPVTVGTSAPVGRSTPTGYGVSIGSTQPTGTPVAVGSSVSSGRPSTVGVSSATGSAIDIGRSVSVGASTSTATPVAGGQPIPPGQSMTVGRATAVGSPGANPFLSVVGNANSSASAQPATSGMEGKSRPSNPYTSVLSQPSGRQLAIDTIREIPHTTKEVGIGFVEGSATAVKNIGSGAVNAVKHPIETAEGIGNTVAHPFETGKAVGAEAADGVAKFRAALERGDGRAVGQTLGNVYTNVGVGLAAPEGRLGAAATATRGVTAAERAAASGSSLTSVANLGYTIERIKSGKTLNYINDGAVFQNKESLLPKKPAGYYTEWVHPTSGIGHAGEQRIVVGKGGEIYYTPDHYKTFVPLDGSQ